MTARAAKLIDLTPRQPAEVLRGCLVWPAANWLGLPASWSMLVAHAGGQAALITTRAADYHLARSRRWAVAAGDDWLALASAAADERACLAVEQWLDDGWSVDPWRLAPQSLAACLGPAVDRPVIGVTTQEVLAHFALTLIDLDPELRVSFDFR